MTNTDILTDITPGAENITRDEQVAALVLAGVALRFQQHPKFVAMAQSNDRDRFIEGCQSDPEFMRVFTLALAEIRALAA